MRTRSCAASFAAVSFARNRPSNGLALNEDGTAPGAASWVGLRHAAHALRVTSAFGLVIPLSAFGLGRDGADWIGLNILESLQLLFKFDQGKRMYI